MASKKNGLARASDAAEPRDLLDDVRNLIAIDNHEQAQPEGFELYDGRHRLGLIKPQTPGFEAFAVIGERLEYLGKAESRNEAARLIREARHA